MPAFKQIPIRDQDLVGSLQDFLARLLQDGLVQAVFAPGRLPLKNNIMPLLTTNPADVKTMDPLAPAFPLNAARMVSRLTRKPSSGLLLAVLRSCEIRAFIELVKLHQARREGMLILGLDCLGAYTNSDFSQALASEGVALTEKFTRGVLAGEAPAGLTRAAACQVCELPIPNEADLVMPLYGVNLDHHFLIEARSQAGQGILDRLGLEEAAAPAERESVLAKLLETRRQARDRMFAATSTAVNSLEKLSGYLAECVNCFNCRVACPVCYCRECVFNTDVFEHEPDQYLQWAKRKGLIKMPTDTVFFHLTRLAHMSTACVGCGQCSNACPNHLPIMELFRTIAARTQAAFDYEAGRSLEEAPPLSTFQADEYPEVTAH